MPDSPTSSQPASSTLPRLITALLEALLFGAMVFSKSGGWNAWHRVQIRSINPPPAQSLPFALTAGVAVALLVPPIALALPMQRFRLLKYPARWVETQMQRAPVLGTATLVGLGLLVALVGFLLGGNPVPEEGSYDPQCRYTQQRMYEEMQQRGWLEQGAQQSLVTCDSSTATGSHPEEVRIFFPDGTTRLCHVSAARVECAEEAPAP